MQITHGPVHFEKEYIFDLISKLVFSGKLFIKKYIRSFLLYNSLHFCANFKKLKMKFESGGFCFHYFGAQMSG